MTPNEIYALQPVRVEYDIYTIEQFLDMDTYYTDGNEHSKRVEIRRYVDKSFDCRRGWTLGSVFFDGEPVFIWQVAGRDWGKDFAAHFVTDPEAYARMLTYIDSLTPEHALPYSVIPPDEDLPELTTFYGASADNFRDFSKQVETYVVDLTQ